MLASGPVSIAPDPLSELLLSELLLSKLRLSELLLSKLPLSELPLSELPLSKLPLSELLLSKLPLSELLLSKRPLSELLLPELPLPELPLPELLSEPLELPEPPELLALPSGCRTDVPGASAPPSSPPRVVVLLPEQLTMATAPTSAPETRMRSHVRRLKDMSLPPVDFPALSATQVRT